MKLLLYCTKSKPYLYYNWNTDTYHTTNSLKDFRGDFGGSRVCSGAYRLCAYQSDGRILTNGHIMLECDFEVEEIFYDLYGDLDWQHDYLPTTNTMSIINLENASCLDREEIENKMKDNKGYAINIKNLHIFDKPRELSDYCLDKAPTRLMKFGLEGIDVPFIWFYILPVSPEEMCRILNEKQTTLVRKVVLKEINTK